MSCQNPRIEFNFTFALQLFLVSYTQCCSNFKLVMTKFDKEMGKKPLMTPKKKETMLQKVYIAVQKQYMKRKSTS